MAAQLNRAKKDLGAAEAKASKAEAALGEDQACTGELEAVRREIMASRDRVAVMEEEAEDQGKRVKDLREELERTQEVSARVRVRVWTRAGLLVGHCALLVAPATIPVVFFVELVVAFVLEVVLRAA